MYLYSNSGSGSGCSRSDDGLDDVLISNYLTLADQIQHSVEEIGVPIEFGSWDMISITKYNDLIIDSLYQFCLRIS